MTFPVFAVWARDLSVLQNAALQPSAKPAGDGEDLAEMLPCSELAPSRSSAASPFPFRSSWLLAPFLGPDCVSFPSCRAVLSVSGGAGLPCTRSLELGTPAQAPCRKCIS